MLNRYNETECQFSWKNRLIVHCHPNYLGDLFGHECQVHFDPASSVQDRVRRIDSEIKSTKHCIVYFESVAKLSSNELEEAYANLVIKEDREIIKKLRKARPGLFSRLAGRMRRQVNQLSGSSHRSPQPR